MTKLPPAGIARTFYAQAIEHQVATVVRNQAFAGSRDVDVHGKSFETIGVILGVQPPSPRQGYAILVVEIEVSQAELEGWRLPRASMGWIGERWFLPTRIVDGRVKIRRAEDTRPLRDLTPKARFHFLTDDNGEVVAALHEAPDGLWWVAPIAVEDFTRGPYDTRKDAEEAVRERAELLGKVTS